jgi:hypothetical protein
VGDEKVYTTTGSAQTTKRSIPIKYAPAHIVEAKNSIIEEAPSVVDSSAKGDDEEFEEEERTVSSVEKHFFLRESQRYKDEDQEYEY